MDQESALQTRPERLAELAQQDPDRPVITHWSPAGETVTTTSELYADAVAIGQLLTARAVSPETLVAIAAVNEPWFYAASHGAWLSGATVLPFDPRMPEPALHRVLRTAYQHWSDIVVLAQGQEVSRPSLRNEGVSRAAGTGAVPESGPGFAFLSGGSSGEPKIILNSGDHRDRAATGRLPGIPGQVGMRSGQVQLVAGPLFHGAPASWSTLGLFHGHSLVLMERFDAAQAVHLIQKHRVEWMFVVPTMMRRIAALPHLEASSLRSLTGVCHASAPCPPAVKEAWLGLVAPELVHEGFGGTEAAGATVISGDEWLLHRGSVGRPVPGWEVAILDDSGARLAAGEIGMIHFRALDADGPSFTYVGSRKQVTDDGWITLGDLGWLDGDGYLFVADRRSDLIIRGGANIYPAEVEAVLHDHEDVADVAVVGSPDADLGQHVVAIVEPEPGASPSTQELQQFCRERLPRYKVPHRVILVSSLPRNEQGKLRRTDLLRRASDAELPTPRL